jgi:Protein of unknown function (DUF2510)
MATMSQTPPGWYPDPQDPASQRYFDGANWTENRAPLAPAAPPPAPLAKKRRGCLTWLLIGGGALVLLIVVVAIAAGSGSSSKPSSSSKNGTSKGFTAGGSTDPTHEVKITSCRKDPTLGLLDVKGTAINDTSKRSDFYITLTITTKDGKTQLGSTNAIAQNVEPGQTARWDAPSTVENPPAGAVCKVSTVSRTASV